MTNMLNIAISGIPRIISRDSVDIGFCKNLANASDYDSFYDADFKYESKVIFSWADLTNEVIAIKRKFLSENDFNLKINELTFKDTIHKLKLNSFPMVVGGRPGIAYGALEAASKKYSFMNVIHLGPKIHFSTPIETNLWGEEHFFLNVAMKISNVKNVYLFGANDITKEEREYVHNINLDSMQEVGMFGGPVVDVKTKREFLFANYDGTPWKDIFHSVINGNGHNFATWLSLDMAIFEQDNLFSGVNYSLGLFFLRMIATKGNLAGVSLCSSGDWDLEKTSEVLYRLSNYTLDGYAGV